MTTMFDALNAYCKENQLLAEGETFSLDNNLVVLNRENTTGLALGFVDKFDNRVLFRMGDYAFSRHLTHSLSAPLLIKDYVLKHCTLVHAKANFRETSFLYYYKEAIHMGVEIRVEINNHVLILTFFNENTASEKKKVREFFALHYFKSITVKPLHKMTKHEKTLVSITYF